MRWKNKARSVEAAAGSHLGGLAPKMAGRTPAMLGRERHSERRGSAPRERVRQGRGAQGVSVGRASREKGPSTSEEVPRPKAGPDTPGRAEAPAGRRGWSGGAVGPRALVWAGPGGSRCAAPAERGWRGWGWPGAAQRGAPGEGDLPWTSGGYSPTLSLSGYKKRHHTFSTARNPPGATALLGACLRTTAQGRLVGSGCPALACFFYAATPSRTCRRAAQRPSAPGVSAQAARPTWAARPATPSRAAASPSSVCSGRHPPRGRVPAAARPGRTPPGPRYLGLSKLHPLRRSAVLFCRRSAAAAPPGSGSIAPGGGRGLGRARVGSGLGGARRAARFASRSPGPAPAA